MGAKTLGFIEAGTKGYLARMLVRSTGATHSGRPQMICPGAKGMCQPIKSVQG